MCLLYLSPVVVEETFLLIHPFPLKLTAQCTTEPLDTCWLQHIALCWMRFWCTAALHCTGATHCTAHRSSTVAHPHSSALGISSNGFSLNFQNASRNYAEKKWKNHKKILQLRGKPPGPSSCTRAFWPTILGQIRKQGHSISENFSFVSKFWRPKNLFELLVSLSLTGEATGFFLFSLLLVCVYPHTFVFSCTALASPPIRAPPDNLANLGRGVKMESLACLWVDNTTSTTTDNFRSSVVATTAGEKLEGNSTSTIDQK